MSIRISIPPHVVHENIDGEVIILNLKDGLYHTLNDSAGFIWAGLAEGQHPDTVASSVAHEFEISDNSIALSFVSGLMDAASKENLLEIEGGWTASDLNGSHDAGDPKHPVIHTYRDMQAALVLDPVHDVDHRTGWPNPKPTDEEDISG